MTATTSTPTTSAPGAPADRDYDALGRAARRRKLIWSVISHLLLATAVVIICLPLAWMLVASVKTRADIYSVPIKLWPTQPEWANYARAWTQVPFGRFLVNSIVVTTIGASLKVINGVLTAYALVYLRFPFKNVIFLIVLAALMVPTQVTIVPNYVLIANLGWINTYMGVIVPTAATAFGTFLMRQQFLRIPTEIIEAARIDGAGHLRRLWQIVLPMSRPTLAAVALISVVNEWNEYLWPLLATTNEKVMTLPVGLNLLRNSEGISEWGVIMAGAVIVIVPVLVVFLLAQRQMVEGLTAGAVKG